MFWTDEKSGVSYEKRSDGIMLRRVKTIGMIYDMTIAEYVDEELAAIDLNEMFTAMFGAIDMGGVYYVEDGVIYAGDDWEDDMEGESFTLDGASLILESITEEFGTQKAFIRVAE